MTEEKEKNHYQIKRKLIKGFYDAIKIERKDEYLRFCQCFNDLTEIEKNEIVIETADQLAELFKNKGFDIHHTSILLDSIFSYYKECTEKKNAE